MGFLLSGHQWLLVGHRSLNHLQNKEKLCFLKSEDVERLSPNDCWKQEETEQLSMCCRENSILFDTSKTKEVINDFRRKKENKYLFTVHGKIFVGRSGEGGRLLLPQSSSQEGPDRKKGPAGDSWFPLIGISLGAS
ncbi:hypothetical protein CHARACLAT_032086 [Characodon lateralis]|uniref:Uncharacterized protein n=1 Tax=Characodon lateralis TaxID=208331 RepID=A0ABU7DLR4_9TELE|nr:hypothetical protein [Characodon lateralis]